MITLLLIEGFHSVSLSQAFLSAVQPGAASEGLCRFALRFRRRSLSPPSLDHYNTYGKPPTPTPCLFLLRLSRLPFLYIYTTEDCDTML